MQILKIFVMLEHIGRVFFKLLGKNLRSITDIDNWGESSGGITHPTVQYSSKGSRLGDHVEHYNFASVNLHHHGGTK